MRKFTLLLLAVVAGMGTASAEDITRRIWAYCDWGGDWQSANNSIRIHYFKSDGTDITSWGASDTQYMSRFNNTNWFFYDITADESVLSSVKVIIRANSGDNQTQTYSNDSENMDLVNKCYKLKVEYANEANRATVSELKYYLFNTADITERYEMTSDDCVTFTATVDNQTTPSTKYYAVAPSFAFSDDFSTTYWGLVFRPWAEHQTLAFENVSERTFFAEDNNSNTWKTNGVPAFFKWSVNTLNWKYAVDAFITREINATAGYATFSFDAAVTLPFGVDAYYASGLNDSKQVMLTKFVDNIPANTGALLKGSGEVTFTPASSATVPSSNMLVATVEETLVAKDNHNYILANGDNGVGFYYVADDNIKSGAGKAYLHANEDLADESTTGARVSWIFQDDATAINAVENAQNSETVYDLQGRQAKSAKAGLYIKNGKKFIVK